MSTIYEAEVKSHRENLARHLAAECGMTCIGKNVEGVMEFVGTDTQWLEYKKLKEENNLC